MSQQLITNESSDGAMVTRPQQTLQTQESSRVLAEVQASIMLAKANPRDEAHSLSRIKISCQRQRLAELSQYTYSKGGTNITGPSIRLLESVATHWGNVTYGFRELSNSGGESTVESFAWDLENNTKAVRVFTVPHAIMSRGSRKPLTDPRDIYELIANQAQRRVRSCLEEIIPRDIIEDAVDECNRTLKAKCDLSPDRLKEMVAKFDKFGVTREQIKVYLGRDIESIQAAQFLALGRIFVSLRDGMADASNWFKPIVVESEVAPQTTKEKLRKPVKETPKESPKVAANQDAIVDVYRQIINKTTSTDSLATLRNEVEADTLLSLESKAMLGNEIAELIEIASEIVKG